MTRMLAIKPPPRRQTRANLQLITVTSSCARYRAYVWLSLHSISAGTPNLSATTKASLALITPYDNSAQFLMHPHRALGTGVARTLRIFRLREVVGSNPTVSIEEFRGFFEG
ncbi:uncharacterized protein SCHCODRAFT_02630553 [Schizophyllum commune H4-8]|uniref:uncharacterized protein n=1 Tax=Schizophyllum commune (strain H4-8 / FGSC 9210) TaxID=578458 RepID=UPI002160EAF7|nr:uncharacterized protein SCHCODRAFT_02630553 [Schizophyllum commune H4-8]KAI5889984.1 hypothetical protein SCHCODRAFT_02630553 [Schizophyllum commune H4-8]